MTARGLPRAAAAITAALLAAGPARAEAPADPEAKARAWFTDTVLLTQDGEEVRFYSDVLADRVVALDFVFTRCEMACPLLTAKLNRVRALLGPLFGAEVSFVSISVDPGFDTPQELSRFARKHGADHPRWTWLTGEEEDVKRVLRRLGERVDDPDQHSTELILGNTRTRHWIKVRPDAPPEATALQLRRLVEEGPARPLPGGAAVSARE